MIDSYFIVAKTLDMQVQQQQYNWFNSNKNAQVNTFNLNLTNRKICKFIEK